MIAPGGHTHPEFDAGYRAGYMAARSELENLNHVENALQEVLCWLAYHSSMPEAETLAERISQDVGLAIKGCKDCAPSISASERERGC